jgi:hypothetical protein
MLGRRKKEYAIADGQGLSVWWCGPMAPSCGYRYRFGSKRKEHVLWYLSPRQAQCRERSAMIRCSIRQDLITAREAMLEIRAGDRGLLFEAEKKHGIGYFFERAVVGAPWEPHHTTGF